MTQEDKELLLKDLCGRIPYGVKVELHENVCTLLGYFDDFVMLTANVPTGQQTNISNIKPYLRPMSSMNEDEQEDFSVFIGRTERYVQQICLDADSIANPIIGGFKCVYWGLFNKCIDWLNKKMFDYRGLIPMGLALEAPENMYKNKLN